MNDEKLIIKFLEDNYRVGANSSDFIIHDNHKIEPNFMLLNEFEGIFKTIFTDNSNVMEIYNNWLASKKSIIMSDLYAHLQIIDVEKGGVFLEMEMLNKFTHLHRDFIINFFNSWYSFNILDVKFNECVKDLVLRLGPRNWEICKPKRGIYNLSDMLREEFNKDTSYQQDYISRSHEKWYETKVLEACEEAMNKYY